MYTQGHNSVFQTPVISSWSDLRKKRAQVSVGFKLFPNTFQKGKLSKKTWFEN